MSDSLRLGSAELSSRLILGTGKYESLELMKEALEASGTSMVTVAVRRVELGTRGKIENGEILFRTPEGDVVDLVQQDEEPMRRIRGNQISMIFQEPLTLRSARQYQVMVKSWPGPTLPSLGRSRS